MTSDSVLHGCLRLCLERYLSCNEWLSKPWPERCRAVAESDVAGVDFQHLWRRSIKPRLQLTQRRTK